MRSRTVLQEGRVECARSIASGGAATLDDIRALLALEPDGVEGVIVGRALYNGSFKLREAMGLRREA